MMEVTIDVLEPSESPGEMPPGIRYLKDKISRSPLKYQSYLELATAFRSIPRQGHSHISIVAVPALRNLGDGEDSLAPLVHQENLLPGQRYPSNPLVKLQRRPLEWSGSERHGPQDGPAGTATGLSWGEYL